MKQLIADDGMVYTDGDSYGREICLPDGADESVWRQVDESLVPEDGGPMRYSVVSIIGAMREIGKYDEFRAWLERERYDWDFIGANYLAENHPTFRAMSDALVGYGIVTREQFAELLSKCFWRAD